MINRNFKDVPAIMKDQAINGKKDRYIELTEILANVDYESADVSERIDYMKALLETLEYMDFQIYELFRCIEDKFRECLNETLKLSMNDEEKSRLKDIVVKACEKAHILREHYEALLCDCTQVKIDKSILSLPENLRIVPLFVSARTATIELENVGKYTTDKEYILYINGVEASEITTSVYTAYGLKPETEYELTVVSKDRAKCGRLKVTTEFESVTLNVREFGAKGDGVSDDTTFIQAAILSCPKHGRVLISGGTFRFTSLFLKSHTRLEIAKDAELMAIPERSLYSKQPYAVMSTNGKDEYHFGTWEGNPLPMFTGVMTGYEVEDVIIYGEGVLNGAASKENWWNNPKVMNGAYRPRLFFINKCNDISMIGITLKNSPAWTIHPFFSKNLKFLNVSVQNPSDSPNTDGLDPESCTHVEIAGVKFSLGDDCIAVKAGKIYMGRKYKTPSSDIRIHHCLMENGHGAVTIGSEMAGGVKDLSVEDCEFSHTDRGLRIKTRRGRGKDAILDNIAFRRINMDNVMTPFVVNSFYFCDPDGKTDYVQSREAFPVDERTPYIKRLIFEDIDARNCHVAATYFEGLPEQKIDEIIMRRVYVDFCDSPKCDVPAMSSGVEACTKKGVFAKNVSKMIMDDVEINGCVGEKFVLEAVDSLS